MSALLSSCALWLRRHLLWSNSRQSWNERLALALLLIWAGLLVHLVGRLTTFQAALAWGSWLVWFALLFRRGWIKLFGPVFFYDLVRTARRGRYFVLRCSYVAFLMFALFWIHWFWSQRFSDRGIPAEELANLNEAVFVVFMLTQFAVGMLLTPAYAGGAIAEEKERRTLEYLFATDLRNREIILGKLL